MKVGTTAFPGPLIGGFLLLQGFAITLVAMGHPTLVMTMVGAVLVLVLATASSDVGPAMIALVPLTQPFLLGSRGDALALYPEYVVIPAVFVWIAFSSIRSGRVAFRRSGLVLPGLVFLVVAAASLAGAALDRGMASTSAGLATLYVHLLALLFFVTLIEWLRPERSLYRVFVWMFSASVVVSLLGLVEYMIADAPTGRLVRIGSTLGVVFSSENRGNPNALAAYVTIMSLMALSMMGSVRARVRVWLASGILLHILALLLTRSRSGLVALLVGVLWLVLRGRRQMLWWLLPAAVVGITVAAQIPRMFERYASILAVVSSQDLIRFFLTIDPKSIDWKYLGYFGAGGFDIDALAGANRFAAWVLGIRTFLEHPFLGIGLQMNLAYTGFSTSENYFLDIAVMTGILGLLPVVWWGARVWRTMRLAGRLEMGKDERAFIHGFEAVMIAVAIIGLTGSILFSLKIMLTLLTLVAMLW